MTYTNEGQPPVKPTCFGTQPVPKSDLYAERRCGFCDVNTSCDDLTIARVDAITNSLTPVPPACPTCGEQIGSKACTFAHEKKTPEVGTKHDKGKPRWSLIPVGVMKDVIAVLEFGAQKYSVGNWSLVEDPGKRYYDAAMRHIDARADGEKMDPDSGLPHLAHAVCCLMFLMWFEARSKC